MSNVEHLKNEVNSRNEELFCKLISGEINLEEAEELTQKVLSIVLENTELIQALRENLNLKLNENEMLESAAIVYQDFITSKGLNEDFLKFFEETYLNLKSELN